ncbi:hypothetical protein [Halostagnicola sp. A-GB9-2]|nr:hypothetical protein [Halostagnicola sp. A-GB9-2]MDJ1432331.1 hypothetical protein [Halostagnicola sp. A-GB9-2]
MYTPEEPAGTHSALVAIETSPRSWEGFWTFDPESVTEIDSYIRKTL